MALLAVRGSSPTMTANNSTISSTGTYQDAVPNLALFISGGEINDIDTPSGLNLFIQQDSTWTSYNTQRYWYEAGLTPSPTLFVGGSEGAQELGRAPLFVDGFVGFVEGSMNLAVINSFTPFFMPMSITGTLFSVTRVGTVAPLLTSGLQPFNSIFPHLPLFMQQDQIGMDNVDNPLPMFVSGPTAMNSHTFNPTTMGYLDPTLYISGGTFLGANKTVYLTIHSGGVPCETMNLFVRADEWSDQAGSVPLFLYADTVSSTRALLGFDSRMNLVVWGTDSGGQSRVLNLTVRGGGQVIDGWAPLYVEAADGGEVFDMPLFVKGLGVNPGAFPFSDSLGLFIQRGPQGGIPMFVQGISLPADYMSQGGIPVAGQIPLAVLGVAGPATLTGTSPLFVSGFGGDLSQTVKLFIDGDVFHAITGTSTLALPNVVGFQPSSAALYVNGFNY